MMIRKCKPLPLILFIMTLFLASTSLTGYSHANYDKAPIPLSSAVQLTNMTYSYNPIAQTLTKQYTFKNISGQTLLNPRLVNTFLWSNIFNNACAVDWLTMGYDGTSTFLNVDQSATVSGNNGTIDWSSQVYPYSLTSTEIFPSLPLQSVQSGVSYPYWNITSPWNDQDTRTIDVSFSNVSNCKWIQNMVWVIYEEGGTPPTTSVPLTTTIPTTTTTQIPTLITLSYFQAIPGDREVTLMWRTESEIDTAGFNIYRGIAGRGRYGRGASNTPEMEKINDTLIPAKGSSASGAEYTFIDDDVRNGIVYIYQLEDVDMSGVATKHEPVKVTPRWINSLFHLSR
jgi:hypothetical protein